MNENETIDSHKKLDDFGEKLTLVQKKIPSIDSKNWDFTKRSTLNSNNINNDCNHTASSVQNIYGENKFKIQYELVSKESQQNVKRFSRLIVKIDNKSSSKSKKPNSNLKFIKFKSEPQENIEINKDNENYKISDSKKVKIRKDAYGIPIVKNNNLHKVSFMDNFPSKQNIFVETFKVESYKKYNLKSEPNKDTEKVNCNCKPIGCFIF